MANIRMYDEVQNNSEALVMAHLGMVKRVALHLKVRLPPFMELDELIQVGMIGLLEAARAYNPGRGIDFENFAHSRVRGAILDEVRRLSFFCPDRLWPSTNRTARPPICSVCNWDAPPPKPNWPSTSDWTLKISTKRGLKPKGSRHTRSKW